MEHPISAKPLQQLKERSRLTTNRDDSSEFDGSSVAMLASASVATGSSSMPPYHSLLTLTTYAIINNLFRGRKVNLLSTTHPFLPPFTWNAVSTSLLFLPSQSPQCIVESHNTATSNKRQ